MAKSAPATGFPCPQCATRTRVYDTISRPSGLERLRRCTDPHCGYRFRSREVHTPGVRPQAARPAVA